MRLQSYIKEIRKVGKRCFTLGDMVKELHISHNYARVALHRLLRTKDLISPARGLYVIVPPEQQPYGSIPPQELLPLIMQHAHANYYVALLTAGIFHGATHQKSARFQVISDKRIKHPLSFGDVSIEFIYKYSISGLPIQNVMSIQAILN
jgi:predicted transcriptional regulator of viral defense system